MPKLIINPTSSSRREVRLARTLLSIGRDPSNDLVLPDAMVSRRHAVIECRGNQYYLRDCNSSNGSVVNGDRISERSLRDGDLVAIGTARLLFREEHEIEDPGAKIVQHPSAPRLRCGSCQADYRKGDLFCRECGAPLQPPVGPRKVVCASCGTAVVLPAKFCNACGARLPAEDGQPSPGAGLALAAALPATEQPPGPEALPEGELGPTVSPSVPSAPSPSAPQEKAVAPARSLAPEPRRVARPAMAEAPLPGDEPAAPPLARKPAPVPASPPAPAARPAERPWRPAGPGSVPARAAAAKPAGAGVRLLAALVDAVLVAVLQAAIVGPLAYLWAARAADLALDAGTGALPVLVTVGLSLLAVLVGAAYHVVFWAALGATPGKRWTGLQVVAEDGSRLGWGRALARGVGYAVSGAALGIGFLMVAFGGVGLHDRIAGTRVVPRREE